MVNKYLLLVLLIWISTTVIHAQTVMSPEEAGIEPITGDLTPWRDFGVDSLNFDRIWALALSDGKVVVLKRAGDPSTPGVIGGSEFLIYAPDGTQITPAPVIGNYESNGNPTPFGDATAGEDWGAFTLGAHTNKAFGSMFVVHNQGNFAQGNNLDHADEVGNEAHSLLQLFNADGEPIGSSINAFGTLTGIPGDWRDVGSLILSNGDLVSLGENRQVTDDLLDEIASDAGEVATAIIVGQDGSVKSGPFAPHVGDDGFYLGGSSSVVFQNMAAFDGGFVIDYGNGIRWYNNDGTPITPSQPDHADIEGEEVIPEYIFFMPANSGGRGDSMCIASNGSDTIVKTIKLEAAGESIGVLIYYNTDGTVRNFVQFDGINVDEEIPAVDRTFCDVDENGNVFVVWEDERFGGSEHTQAFGRFFNAAGEPYGPGFPIFENWKSEPEFVDYGGSIGQVGRREETEPRCAINNEVAVVVSGTTILDDLPETTKQLSSAFALIINDPIVRIFKNPYAEAQVNEWELY